MAKHYVLYTNASVTVSSQADTNQVDDTRASQEKSKDGHKG